MMPLQNILQGNYNTGESPYQIKLPIELGVKIADNDPVRLLDSLVDAMDLTELNNSYGRRGKKTAKKNCAKKIWNLFSATMAHSFGSTVPFRQKDLSQS